jgi:RNA-directed DNA polymerase
VESIDRMKAATLDDVIRMLHPKIAGWWAYCKTEVSSHAVQRLDHLLWHKRYGWAKRKHSRKSAAWVGQHDFQPDGKSTHGSVAGEAQTLRWPRNTPVKRHVTLRKGVSPYDGNWSYWGTRRGKYIGLETTRGKLLKHQGGRCTHCRLFFTVDDKIEIHHADGNHKNRQFTNLSLLHLICHDLIHGAGQRSTMNISTARRTHDKSDITEEPCASKEASTVLETSREG